LNLYGELKQSRRMAAAIVKARQTQPIATTGDLQAVVAPFINKKNEKKELAQVFQALRIEVNHEMQALEEMLRQAVDCLAPDGRLVVMTYHSLEDRLVKNIIKTGNTEGTLQQDFYGRILAPLKAVNNKIITAGDEEVESNPRARSAKLRIARRKNEEEA
jgi:16S rRNA (cytosine1402-N4)-methyltransferase